MVRLRNEFVPIDPRVWNSNMDVSINVALGRGTDAERMMMLRQIGEMQKDAMKTMGPQNPLTDITKLSNTLKAMTELAGFKDTSQSWSEPRRAYAAPEAGKAGRERNADTSADPADPSGHPEEGRAVAA